MLGVTTKHEDHPTLEQSSPGAEAGKLSALAESCNAEGPAGWRTRPELALTLSATGGQTRDGRLDNPLAGSRPISLFAEFAKINSNLRCIRN
jgi:hypothetical protein